MSEKGLLSVIHMGTKYYIQMNGSRKTFRILASGDMFDVSNTKDSKLVAKCHKKINDSDYQLDKSCGMCRN